MKQSSLSGGIGSITSMAVEDSSILWSPELSDSLYNIHGWGDPYFSVNSYGNMCAHPNGKEGNTLQKEEIDLLQVVKKVTCCCSSGGLGLQPPLLIRLPEVLRNRLESLQSAFDLAIISRGYESHYQGVYPVKCNQDRSVVEDIVRFGIPFRFGLEAGSKPELLLTMSCLCKAHPDSFLICNGFKDEEYVSLALMARKLSLNSVIVLEQEEELPLVIHMGTSLGIRPVIGVRAKLRTKHCGHFGGTSGEKGKFGLSTAQILRVVRKLEEEDMLDCLQLLHFHIGSQIPSTDIVTEGISEAAQIYCELVRLGANMRVIDIGGGLGIDYDGSHSGESDLSVAYNLEEYAMAVVTTVQFICDGKSVTHPVICSESGRAIVSHHSVLIFNASSSSSSSSSPPQASSPSINHADLQHLLEGVTEADSNGDLRDDYMACAMHENVMKQRCLQRFKEGSLTLEQVAAVDSLCEFAAKVYGDGEEAVRTYNVNLSVFTSIPDFWGIGQLYPIVPVHRLDERPMVRGILSDLTCDSDGKIDKFINGESTLLLHEEEEEKESYYLGLFLGGAYEEALGGLHNLFGGVSVVRAVSRGDGQNGFCVTVGTQGRTCGDVLGAMQHEPGVMFQTLKHRAVEVGGMVGMDPIALVLFFGRMFDSMPYLSLPSSSTSCAMVCSGSYYEEEEGCRGVTGDAAAVSEDDVWTAYCCA